MRVELYVPSLDAVVADIDPFVAREHRRFTEWLFEVGEGAYPRSVGSVIRLLAFIECLPEDTRWEALYVLREFGELPVPAIAGVLERLSDLEPPFRRVIVDDNLLRELPIGGKTVRSGTQTWTIEVRGITSGAPESSVRTADLVLRGTPSYLLLLRVPGEALVVDHREGDVDWILDGIRAWLNDPDAKSFTNELALGFPAGEKES